jgi:hypothetical protein
MVVGGHLVISLEPLSALIFSAWEIPRRPDAALSRSKLGGNCVYRLVGTCRSGFIRENSRTNKSFANKFAPTYSAITHEINDMRVV